mmetsp:Transcript_1877/g.2041  ORF Transcript_1877/g.2041 Transcript_1877/m.2041 type:complete len:96 (+) Transcript_1877:193-480(+)
MSSTPNPFMGSIGGHDMAATKVKTVGTANSRHYGSNDDPFFTAGEWAGGQPWKERLYSNLGSNERAYHACACSVEEGRREEGEKEEKKKREFVSG